MSKTPFALAAIATFLLSASAAHAVTYVMTSEGYLGGANGVAVNGLTYNVRFVDGACIDLFNGCNSSSDFDFTSFVDAQAAAQALLDQVFIDGDRPYDTFPDATWGCTTAPDECSVLVPFEEFSGSVGTYAAVNTPDVDDGVAGESYDPTLDTGFWYNIVYARFTPVQTAVPEPSTWATMLLGFGAIGLAMRRAKKAGRTLFARDI